MICCDSTHLGILSDNCRYSEEEKVEAIRVDELGTPGKLMDEIKLIDSEKKGSFV